MNRRSFLTGLIALPVAAELGRVYSFPTDIVIATPVQTYLFGKDAVYCANLPQSTVKYYSMKFKEHLHARMFEEFPPNVADPSGVLAEAAFNFISKGYTMESYANTTDPVSPRFRLLPYSNYAHPKPRQPGGTGSTLLGIDRIGQEHINGYRLDTLVQEGGQSGS